MDEDGMKGGPPATAAWTRPVWLRGAAIPIYGRA